MRRAFLTLLAAGAVVAATVSSPTKAEARCWGCWAGGAFALGVVGGALWANRAYGYYGYPAYYGYYGYPYSYGYAPYYSYPYYGYRYSYGYPYYGYGHRYPYARYGYYGGHRYYGRGYYRPARVYARRAAYRRW